MQSINFSPHCQIVEARNEDFDDLPVLTTRWGNEAESPGIISCWRPSILELIGLIFTRRIYVQILAYKHPPIFLSVNKAPMQLGETEVFLSCATPASRRIGSRSK